MDSLQIIPLLDEFPPLGKFCGQVDLVALDYTINIGAYEWRIHKSLLSEKSGWFKRMFSDEKLKDGHESRIYLNENPVTISKALQWFYTEQFDWGGKGGIRINGKPTISEILDIGMLPGSQQLQGLTPQPAPSANHQYAADLAAMYVFANQYEVPDLRARVLLSITMWIRMWIGYEPVRILKLIWNALPQGHIQHHGQLRRGLASVAAETMVDRNGNLSEELRDIMGRDHDFCLKVADALAFKLRTGIPPASEAKDDA